MYDTHIERPLTQSQKCCMHLSWLLYMWHRRSHRTDACMGPDLTTVRYPTWDPLNIVYLFTTIRTLSSFNPGGAPVLWHTPDDDDEGVAEHSFLGCNIRYKHGFKSERLSICVSNTIFVSSYMYVYPKYFKTTRVIVDSMNTGYIARHCQDSQPVPTKMLADSIRP